MMGLRLGAKPRVVVTTTPKSVPLLKRVQALPALSRRTGGRDENVHLPDAFVAWAEATYGGTRLGRQELEGELSEEVEGALFTRELLERARVEQPAELVRIVVGVDPPASSVGTCGIVVCGADSAGTLYVLADASIGGASPERWARAVAAAARGVGRRSRDRREEPGRGHGRKRASRRQCCAAGAAGQRKPRQGRPGRAGRGAVRGRAGAARWALPGAGR